ncbi:MAG: hypothetical protein IAC58_02970 [Firmicutes bacterium]|uniref:Uncharacterized protein n=1 Tax=Candidatus Onthovivens merdipullorum TaxID=2840889 RepID=A0A9D9DM02_9BACL|nr:hypothetical protein [Candidatus Onthovivens merdipullorum]
MNEKDYQKYLRSMLIEQDKLEKDKIAEQIKQSRDSLVEYASHLNDYKQEFQSQVLNLIQHISGLVVNALYYNTTYSKHWFDECCNFVRNTIDTKLKQGNNRTKEKALIRAINEKTNNLNVEFITQIIKEFYVKENFEFNEDDLKICVERTINILMQLVQPISDSDMNEIRNILYNIISDLNFEYDDFAEFNK